MLHSLLQKSLAVCEVCEYQDEPLLPNPMVFEEIKLEPPTPTDDPETSLTAFNLWQFWNGPVFFKIIIVLLLSFTVMLHGKAQTIPPVWDELVPVAPDTIHLPKSFETDTFNIKVDGKQFSYVLTRTSGSAKVTTDYKTVFEDILFLYDDKVKSFQVLYKKDHAGAYKRYVVYLKTEVYTELKSYLKNRK